MKYMLVGRSQCANVNSDNYLCRESSERSFKVEHWLIYGSFEFISCFFVFGAPRPLKTAQKRCLFLLSLQFILTMNDETVHCCAECGVAGEGVSLKACKSCMLVRYCNANCQKNHWPTHKQECKRRAAELRDEALFKDPPPKEECPICFLPMPEKLIYCISLPPATILSVPIFDLAQANEALANMVMEVYYTCCGTNICGGCVYSFAQSGNEETCPFCKARTGGKTHDDRIGEVMKRVDVNDAGAMYILGCYYYHGHLGLQQDLAKGVELWTQAAKLGSSKAHFALGVYYQWGSFKEGQVPL